MYVRSLTVSLIFSNKIDTKLKHILLFQKKKIQHGALDGARTGCVPRRENPLYNLRTFAQAQQAQCMRLA